MNVEKFLQLEAGQSALAVFPNRVLMETEGIEPLMTLFADSVKVYQTPNRCIELHSGGRIYFLIATSRGQTEPMAGRAFRWIRYHDSIPAEVRNGLQHLQRELPGAKV